MSANQRGHQRGGGGSNKRGGSGRGRGGLGVLGGSNIAGGDVTGTGAERGSNSGDSNAARGLFAFFPRTSAAAVADGAVIARAARRKGGDDHNVGANSNQRAVATTAAAESIDIDGSMDSDNSSVSVNLDSPREMEPGGEAREFLAEMLNEAGSHHSKPKEIVEFQDWLRATAEEYGQLPSFTLLENSEDLPRALERLPFLLYRPPVLEELRTNLHEDWRVFGLFLFEELERVCKPLAGDIDTGFCAEYEAAWVFVIEIISGMARAPPRKANERQAGEWLKRRWICVRSYLGPRFLEDSELARERREKLVKALRAEARVVTCARQVGVEAEKRVQPRPEGEEGEEDLEWRDRTIRRVCSLVGRSRISEAVAALSQEGPAPLLDAEKLRQLKSLHPEEPNCQGFEHVPSVTLVDRVPMIPLENTAVISVEDVQSRSQTFYDDGKAPGATGISGSFVAPWIPLSRIALPLSRFWTYITSGRLSQGGDLHTILSSSRLIGLPKPGTTTLRPIGLGEWLSKIAQKLVLAKLIVSGVIRDCFPEIQMGVLCPSGTERVILELQALLDEGADTTRDGVNRSALLQLDQCSAFNALSREWMASVLVAHPMLSWLWPSFRSFVWTSRGDTGRHLLCHNRGQLCGIIRSKTGVVQGSVLSAIIFSLGLQPWYQRVSELCSKSSVTAALDNGDHELWRYSSRDDIKVEDLEEWRFRSLAVIDDYDCAGTLPAVTLVLEVAAKTTPPGVKVAWRKTSVLVDDRKRSRPDLLARIENMGAVVVEGAAKMLGGIVGFSDHLMEVMVDSMYEKGKKKELDLLFKRLRDWPLPLQVKMLLQRMCLSPTMGYVVRTMRPIVCRNVLKAFDDSMLATTTHLLKLDGVEGGNPAVMETMRTPTALGGLGIVSAADTSHRAFLAAAVAAGIECAELERQFFGLTSPTRRAMEGAWEVMDRELGRHAASRQRFLAWLELKQSAGGLVTLERLIDVLKPIVLGKKLLGAEMGRMEKEMYPLLLARVERQAQEGTEEYDRIWGTFGTAEAIDREAQKQQRQQRLARALVGKKARLQRTFTLAVWTARIESTKEEYRRITAAAVEEKKNEIEEAPKRVEAKTLSQQEADVMILNAERRVMKAGCMEASLAARLLPTAGVFWSTIPEHPALRVRDDTLTLFARGMLGLPPTPGMTHCDVHKHDHVAFKGLNDVTNRAYALDGLHYQWCRGCIDGARRSTLRHDEVVQAIKSIALDAGCTVDWEPSLGDALSKAQMIGRESLGNPEIPFRRLDALLRGETGAAGASGGGEQAEVTGASGRGKEAAAPMITESNVDSRRNGIGEAVEDGEGLGVTGVEEQTSVQEARAAAGERGATGRPKSIRFGPAAFSVDNWRKLTTQSEQREQQQGISQSLRQHNRAPLPVQPLEDEISVRNIRRRAAPPASTWSISTFKTVGPNSLIPPPTSLAGGRERGGRGSLVAVGAGGDPSGSRSGVIAGGGSLGRTPATTTTTAAATATTTTEALPSSATAMPAVSVEAGVIPVHSEPPVPLTVEDIREGEKRPKATRRGGESAQKEKEKRERETEGDLAIHGPLLNRLLLVDVQIVALSAPSRVKEWVERKESSQRDVTAAHLASAVQGKKTHYKNRMRELYPHAVITDREPLAKWNIDLTPAIASTSGGLSIPFGDLLKKLAKHKVGMEEERAMQYGFGVSGSDSHRRFAETLGFYKRVIAASLVRAASRTFSIAPGRRYGYRKAEHVATEIHEQQRQFRQQKHR